MSPPKHLWSDDWERESELPVPSTAPAPVANASTPSRGVESPVGPDRRRWERPTTLGMIAVLVVAGAVWAIASITSGSDHGTTGTVNRPSITTGGSRRTGSSTNPGLATAPAPLTPTTTAQLPGASVPHADALGLELQSVPSDHVIVQAVLPGSPAASVGISVGDDLQTVNGQNVTSPGQVDAILDKLPLGTPVTLQLTQGSEQITAQIQEPGIP